MNEYKKLPAVLTIAGSDSGGGAGIQADLRTFNAFNVYGCSAITAVTSQNPDEVRRVDTLPGEAVACQIETVLDKFPVRFAKSGMLANREIIEVVSEIVARGRFELIVDPVMVSTSGTRLLEESAVSAMKENLFPLAKWITPNIPEAELICGVKIDSGTDLVSAARDLYEQFECNVILKSGHLLHADFITDVVCFNGKLFALSSPRVNVDGNTAHGTGCTLSAALTAGLASGQSWTEALMRAKAFVCGSLAESVTLSETLRQMYPPEKSRLEQITLTVI